MDEQMTEGGYWFPYLNSGPSAGLVPWSPAHRDEAGNVDQRIQAYFQTAGQVMSYLARSGLTPAYRDEVETTNFSGQGCGHTDFGTPCAKCTTPAELTAHGQTSTKSEIEKIMDAEREGYRADGPPDDDRFEWVEDQFFGDPEPRWIRGQCHHLTPAPVDLRTGQLVAWWCPDCGEQFEWDRWPVPDHLWVPLPEIKRRPVRGVDFVDTYADPRLIGTSEFRAAMNRAHASKVTVVMPDGTSYTPLWQNPMMTDDGWPKPWPVRAFITTRDLARTTARYTWPVWLALIVMVLGLMSEGKLP